MSPLSYLPPQADCVLIAANPKAGATAGELKAKRLAGLLRERGWQVEIVSVLNDIRRWIDPRLAAGRLRAVVAAGGDGTVAEMVNRTEPEVPIAVLPLGTENLLAKYIGLDPDPQAVAQAITDGAVLKLDAGRAGSRVFVMMASCGFDADVVLRLHRERHGHIRHANYLKPILDSLRSYEYPELRIYCEGDEGGAAAAQPYLARWMFLFNLPCYGGGLPLAPQAVGTDGLLDLCAFREGSLWQGLRYLSAVVLGQHQRLADCMTTRLKRIRVEADRAVPYQLDGDPGGFLPLEAEVLSERLSLIVPAARWTKNPSPSGRG